MNFLKTLRIIAAIAGISISASVVGAAPLVFPSSDATLSGPGASGTLGSGGGGRFFQSGVTLSETFAGTGLASATSSTWNFTMSDFTANGVVNTFNALINGIVVDTFSFIGRSEGPRGTQSISLSNSFSAIAGDTFTLSIRATSTVFPGGGSWNWYSGGTVTLSGVSPVPLPASLPFLLVALGALGLVNRRRKAA